MLEPIERESHPSNIERIGNLERAVQDLNRRTVDLQLAQLNLLEESKLAILLSSVKEECRKLRKRYSLNHHLYHRGSSTCSQQDLELDKAQIECYVHVIKLIEEQQDIVFQQMKKQDEPVTSY